MSFRLRFGRLRDPRLICAVAAFVLPLFVYAFSLDRDVGFWDTAELNTVPYILGLAHPTGFPADILAGWSFIHLFPFGEVTIRLALLNAIEIAGAAYLLYLFVEGETHDPFAGLLVAIGFGLLPVTWLHATHNDEMSLTVLLSAAVFVLVRRFWKRNDGRALLGAGVCFGLDLGTHGAAALYLIAPALVAAYAALRGRHLRVFVAASAIAFVTTTAVYAYMPLRSSYVVAHRLDPTMVLGLPPGRPFWDWGDPRTIPTFVDVVTGSQFSHDVAAAGSAYVDPARLPNSAAHGAQIFAGAMGLLALALVLALGIVAAFADVALLAYLVAPACFITPFVVNYLAEPDPSRYYIFPAWALCVGAGVGIAMLLRKKVAVLALTVIVAFAELDASQALFEQPSDRAGFSYIDAVLARTPANAIVIAEWDYVSPIAYAAYVQHRAQARVVVPGEARDFAGYIAGWSSTAPVFDVAEHRPSSPSFAAHYLCNFFVIPGAEHDPKLYRIGTVSGSRTDRPAHDTPARC